MQRLGEPSSHCWDATFASRYAAFAPVHVVVFIVLANRALMGMQGDNLGYCV